MITISITVNLDYDAHGNELINPRWATTITAETAPGSYMTLERLEGEGDADYASEEARLWIVHNLLGAKVAATETFGYIK